MKSASSRIKIGHCFYVYAILANGFTAVIYTMTT
jgi:hypothetical protein